jgi:hypothetical protein
VLEIGGELDLLEEPLRADDGGQLGVQHLDGDVAVVLEVLGEVHRGHAARAELALEAVAVGEGGGEAVHLEALPAMRSRSTARQLDTTTMLPSLAGSRKMKCWPSGITS